MLPRSAKFVEIILKYCGDDIFVRGTSGRSPVCTIAELRSYEQIRHLWNITGDSLFIIPCVDENNFVLYAAQRNKVEWLRLAYSLGCAEVFTNVNKSGQNAAHIAAYRGHMETLETLADLGLMCLFDEADLESKRPADLAAARNHEDVVVFLLDKVFRATKGVKTKTKLKSLLMSKQRERDEKAAFSSRLPPIEAPKVRIDVHCVRACVCLYLCVCVRAHADLVMRNSVKAMSLHCEGDEPYIYVCMYVLTCYIYVCMC